MNVFTYFESLYWREPFWLLLTLQPIIIFIIKSIIQNNNAAQYAERKLQPWVIFPSERMLSKYFISKNSAYLLAWLLLSVSIAGPRTPLYSTTQSQMTGANIMLIVDLSSSMKAMDIKPNRLQRVKNEIYEFLEKAKNHRIGIIVFSARPHLLVPLTYDHKVLINYIESIDKLSFPTLGSNPTDAILLAQNELGKSESDNSTTILLSDGDFTVFSKTQIQTLQKEKIPLHILGVGTPEGEAIPLKNGAWLKHNQQYVISKMNSENLKFLASQLNGKFSPAFDDNSDWEILYDKGISKYSQQIDIKRQQDVLWSEEFGWFLVPAILLFIISLSTYTYRTQLSRFKTIYPVALLVFSLITLLPNEATAIELGQTDEQSAYRAYINKDYLKSEKLYKNINTNRIYYSYYGQANSLYKMGHYTKAIKLFSFATVNAKNDAQRAKSLYNLGNSYFHTGNFTLAIESFKDSLRYNPDNTACLYNIKVSTVLKKNIEQRIKEQQRIISLSRQGKGPKTSSVDAGMVISENTSVSMGGNDNKMNKNIPLPKLPNTSEDVIQKLLLTGLNNIKLANKNIELNSPSIVDSRKNIDTFNAQQYINKIQESQHILWKRLFEMEEGFPAPVTEPRLVPGLKPW